MIAKVEPGLGSITSEVGTRPWPGSLVGSDEGPSTKILGKPYLMCVTQLADCSGAPVHGAVAPSSEQAELHPLGGTRPPHRRSQAWIAVLAVFGPGLVVMLADTDAGSVVTAAQSGAQWGYRLVIPELLLIPVLYLVQEITVRLGVATGEGHGALIRRHFGHRWALVSAGTLLIACVGALITEFAGIAGAAQLAGIPDWLSVPAAAVALSFLCVAGRYRRVELVAIALGSLELLFIPAAIMAHAHGGAIAGGVLRPFASNGAYLTILAANVGAVIMPWMVFYHQQAVVDKGISRRYLRVARADTAVGSVLTQVIMIAIVVATAATIGRTNPGAPLDTIGQIAGALRSFLGPVAANVLFGLGMIGAATVAALVVSVAGAWGISEVMGWRHSLNDPFRQAPAFYVLGAGALIISATAVIVAPNLVNLSIDVQVLNAALLPIVLGFLLILERRALSSQDRMHGVRRWVVWSTAAIVAMIGIAAAVNAVIGAIG